MRVLSEIKNEDDYIFGSNELSHFVAMSKETLVRERKLYDFPKPMRLKRDKWWVFVWEKEEVIAWLIKKEFISG